MVKPCLLMLIGLLGLAAIVGLVDIALALWNHPLAVAALAVIAWMVGHMLNQPVLTPPDAGDDLRPRPGSGGSPERRDWTA